MWNLEMIHNQHSVAKLSFSKYTAKKVKFSIKDLVTFTEEILNGKLNFFVQRYTLFSFQPQCCITFSWIELQLLLKCCLIHITPIIRRHILYLVCLCPCLGLGLFASYLCDPFFIFSFIYIVINHITSFKQISNMGTDALVFCTFLIIWMIMLM